jgi:hypothetical protein
MGSTRVSPGRLGPYMWQHLCMHAAAPVCRLNLLSYSLRRNPPHHWAGSSSARPIILEDVRAGVSSVGWYRPIRAGFNGTIRVRVSWTVASRQYYSYYHLSHNTFLLLSLPIRLSFYRFILLLASWPTPLSPVLFLPMLRRSTTMTLDTIL